VIDLAEEKKVCKQLPSYPLAIKYHTAAFIKGKIITCGGNDENKIKTDKCFELGPDYDDWQEVQPLPYGVNLDMESSVMGDKWLISGGMEVVDSLLVHNGDLFEPGLTMPYGQYGHCQVTVNSTHVLLTGGANQILNWETKEFTVLDFAPNPRLDAACGFINSPNFGPEVLIAAADKADIFSLTDLDWKSGPTLPLSVDYLASAQVDGGFVAVGGIYTPDKTYTDVIFKFDENVFEWIVLEETLDIPTAYGAVVAVPNDFLQCQ